MIPSDSATHQASRSPRPVSRSRAGGWLWAAGSVVVLAVLLWGFVGLDPLQPLIGSMPPVEDLTVERVEIGDYGFRLHVINGSPQEVTVAQVLVDDAYWTFGIEPSNSLPRLGQAVVTVPYPWVTGEAHEIMLLTSSGSTFTTEVEVAIATPSPGPATWWTFGLLGLFVGVVPVGLGLLWYPFLRNLGRKGLNGLLALTVGLLVFLLVDTVIEALEQTAALPETLEGASLVWLVTLTSFLLLVAASRHFERQSRSETDESVLQGPSSLSGLGLATFIALGIGLHNLGEGLAIGAAFNLGEAALGSFLVVGFTLHNLTEGIGICAPMTQKAPRLKHFIGLAALAGGPAVLGTWMGAFSFSPVMATLFLALGAGAIAQVVYEVGRLLWNDALQAREPVVNWVNFFGLIAGFVVMYGTALLVAV